MKHTSPSNILPITVIGALLLAGCGEGQDIDVTPSNTVLTQTESENTPENPLDINPTDAPEVPEFTWSLTAYSIGGGDPIDVEELTPDPNWVSNYFFSDTLFTPGQRLSALMDCELFEYEIELTSPFTFRLGVGEPIGVEPDCVTNAPEGLLRGVFEDFTTLLIEGQEDTSIEITNGNGTVLILNPRGLPET